MTEQAIETAAPWWRKVGGEPLTGGPALILAACAAEIDPDALDFVLVGRMRASFLLLGALLARCGRAALPLPGCDAIGLRSRKGHGNRDFGVNVAPTKVS
jgi:UDP-N-acetylglucosamine 1-carboxyvinyltransferase